MPPEASTWPRIQLPLAALGREENFFFFLISFKAGFYVEND